MNETLASDKIKSERPDDRKPYSAPILIAHGTIQELTQAAAGVPTDGAPQPGSVA